MKNENSGKTGVNFERNSLETFSPVFLRRLLIHPLGFAFSTLQTAGRVKWGNLYAEFGKLIQ